MHWTVDQILALAPDPNTAKRGQGLANENKWLDIETNGRSVWGKCKSSGSVPYQTIVDLKGPAFKCNCPSRKFPCKHSLGLLLYSVSHKDNLTVASEIPEIVTTWLEKRDAKTSDSNKPKSKEEQKKADARKAKNFNDRMNIMQAGITDLQQWIQDIVRTGMASADHNVQEMTTAHVSYKSDASSELWRNMSMRMTDAKLSGIARRIREMSLIHGSGADWPSKMLEELSTLYLLAKGFERMDELPELLQRELLSTVGVSQKKDELHAQKGIDDSWMVIGQFVGTNIDNATIRRTWFQGEVSHQFALILEYDYIHQGFSFHWPKGRIFKGEMLFYPSITPMRAIMRNQTIIEKVVDAWVGFDDIEECFAVYRLQKGKNPWMMDHPMALNQMIPKNHEGKLYLTDAKGKGVPVLEKDMSHWKIMALSGGHPIDVFGEWTGEALLPLSILTQDRFIAL